MDIIQPSVNEIVKEDHIRILKVTTRWSGTFWEVDVPEYYEYRGPLSIEDLYVNDWGKFHSEIKKGNCKKVVFCLEPNEFSVGKRFLDDLVNPTDLSIRIGLIVKNMVNVVFRIGNYNYIEVKVEGERNVPLILPGGIEVMCVKGKTTLISIVDGVRNPKIVAMRD